MRAAVHKVRCYLLKYIYMSENSFYRDYDVPQDLQFKTADIIRMGGLECTAQLSPKYFQDVFEAPNKITKVSVKLSFSVATNEILVRGEIAGKRQVQCARCLKMTEQDFAEEFLETYSNKAEIIDIMLQVRQTLALTEDIRFLCKPDCKGLCPQCGQDLNDGPCGCKPVNLSPFAELKGKFK